MMELVGTHGFAMNGHQGKFSVCRHGSFRPLGADAIDIVFSISLYIFVFLSGRPYRGRLLFRILLVDSNNRKQCSRIFKYISSDSFI